MHNPQIPPGPASARQYYAPGPHRTAPYPGMTQLPMGEPPRRKRTGRTAGILAAVAVVLAALGGGLFLLLDKDEDEARGGDERDQPALGADQRSFTLRAPDTLLGGAYTKAGPETVGQANEHTHEFLSGGTWFDARYRNADTDGNLAVIGGYGEVTDAETGVDTLISGFSQGSGLDAEPVEQNPPGFDGEVLKCADFSAAGESIALCAWADSSTVVSVAYQPETGDTPSLEEFAATVVKVRAEVRVAE